MAVFWHGCFKMQDHAARVAQALAAFRRRIQEESKIAATDAPQRRNPPPAPLQDTVSPHFAVAR
jgi:hypothetical protein